MEPALSSQLRISAEIYTVALSSFRRIWLCSLYTAWPQWKVRNLVLSNVKFYRLDTESFCYYNFFFSLH